MKICNLASGSKGNSTFVSFGETKILIDAGLSFLKIKETLEEIGEKIEEISAVFVTHEHIDHVKALKDFAKKTDSKIFISKKLIEQNYFKDISFKDNQLQYFDENEIEFKDFVICPFELSHDAISTFGFKINVKNSKATATFLTDTGVVYESVKSKIMGTKIIFIESNYDEMMLKNGKYPKILQNRISGEFGHLSNEQSLNLAKSLFDGGTKCFVLSHLSENNNTPEIAYLNYANYFESLGLKLDKDVFVRLSFQYKHGNFFSVREEF